MKGKKLSLKSVKVNIPTLKFCLNSIEIRWPSHIWMECFLQARTIVLPLRRTWKLLVSRNTVLIPAAAVFSKYGLLQSCFLLKVHILDPWI